MRLLKLKLGAKLNLLVVALLLLLSIIISLVVRQEVRLGMKDVFVNRVSVVSQLSYGLLDAKYPGDWNIRDGELYKGDLKISGNENFVDQIGNITKGAATVFIGDTRTATNIIDSSGKRAVGTKAPTAVSDVVLKAGQQYSGEADILGKTYQTLYRPIQDNKGKVIGMWLVGTPITVIGDTVNQILKGVYIVIAISLVVSAALVFWFSLNLGRRLGRVSQAMERAGEGDFTMSASDGAADEVGQLSRSFERMKDNLHDLIQQISDSAETVVAASEELQASAFENSKAAEQIAKTVNDMSVGVQTIAVNGQQVAAVSVESSSRARHGVADMAQVANQMDIINDRVTAMAEAVERLGQRSDMIGEIVEAIGDIANQTNLLSLNAAIEAARAGDNGRGFAVVAEEVRKLAEKSAISAKQIAGLLSSIQSETADAVRMTETTRSEVTQGLKQAQTAGASFSDISASVEEVSKQIEEVSAVTEQMSAGSQQVASAAEEQLASMEEIHTSSSAFIANCRNHAGLGEPIQVLPLILLRIGRADDFSL